MLAKTVALWRYRQNRGEGTKRVEMLQWIAIGLIAGAIAKLVMPGRDPGGCIITLLLGIVGAMLAGFVGQLAGLYRAGQSAGLVAATLGAVAILAAYRLFAGRR